jgi:hypothetical protein
MEKIKKMREVLLVYCPEIEDMNMNIKRLVRAMEEGANSEERVSSEDVKIILGLINVTQVTNDHLLNTNGIIVCSPPFKNKPNPVKKMFENAMKFCGEFKGIVGTAFVIPRESRTTSSILQAMLNLGMIVINPPEVREAVTDFEGAKILGKEIANIVGAITWLDYHSWRLIRGYD